MKHDDSQGFPDQWATMTDEDWVEFDKHAEAEHKKMKDWPEGQPFIPKDSKPPF